VYDGPANILNIIQKSESCDFDDESYMVQYFSDDEFDEDEPYVVDLLLQLRCGFDNKPNMAQLGKNPLNHFGNIFFCCFYKRLYTFLRQTNENSRFRWHSGGLFPSNLAWFLVTCLMLPAVTSSIFFTTMQNLDPSVFADTNADPDTDLYLDANADFELFYLKVISMLIQGKHSLSRIFSYSKLEIETSN
ncbi:hypothetical protein H5410_040337, partial [Solanum commersonii]